MLMYTFITFARNAYRSFTENSLVYGNVLRPCLLASLGDRRGLQVILQPPHLCSLHTCSPKAQAPKGIIQESLVLQLSHPSYSQRTKTCFGCAMILTTGSDNIPYMIHLLHLQLPKHTDSLVT